MSYSRSSKRNWGRFTAKQEWEYHVRKDSNRGAIREFQLAKQMQREKIALAHMPPDLLAESEVLLNTPGDLSEAQWSRLKYLLDLRNGRHLFLDD